MEQEWELSLTIIKEHLITRPPSVWATLTLKTTHLIGQRPKPCSVKWHSLELNNQPNFSVIWVFNNTQTSFPIFLSLFFPLATAVHGILQLPSQYEAPTAKRRKAVLANSYSLPSLKINIILYFPLQIFICSAFGLKCSQRWTSVRKSLTKPHLVYGPLIKEGWGY